jgi:hypothetical protein
MKYNMLPVLHLQPMQACHLDVTIQQEAEPGPYQATMGWMKISIELPMLYRWTELVVLNGPSSTYKRRKPNAMKAC